MNTQESLIPSSMLFLWYKTIGDQTYYQGYSYRHNDVIQNIMNNSQIISDQVYIKKKDMQPFDIFYDWSFVQIVNNF